MTEEQAPRKRGFYTEICYVCGMLITATGCALMTRADLGLSMVVAPAYVLHLKLSQYSSFFTFGVTTYIFEAALLVLMMAALRKFRVSYLFSFVTAVIYGYILDGTVWLAHFIPAEALWVRLCCYGAGMLLTALGVSFMLRTYIASEVYELIARVVPAQFGWNLTVFKTCYDVCSCLLAVIFSFAFFGFWHFEGVKWGTVIFSLINGFLIGKICGWMDRHLDFKDAWPLRRLFEV